MGNVSVCGDCLDFCSCDTRRTIGSGIRFMVRHRDTAGMVHGRGKVSGLLWHSCHAYSRLKASCDFHCPQTMSSQNSTMASPPSF